MRLLPRPPELLRGPWDAASFLSCGGPGPCQDVPSHRRAAFPGLRRQRFAWDLTQAGKGDLLLPVSWRLLFWRLSGQWPEKMPCGALAPSDFQAR